MNDGARLQVRFWGVRGSVPTPEKYALTYGGNTSCLEIRYGNQTPLILDAGSGLRRLGDIIEANPDTAQSEAHVFFSHFHWDHIQGLPFFAPLFRGHHRLRFYSQLDPPRLQAILHGQMRSPYFPIDIDDLQNRYECCAIDRDGMAWGDISIRPFSLWHPGGATGYRIQGPAGCIVYASDHEHGDSTHDGILRKYAAGADMLIYDAQYTPEEYKTRAGWGHSTWQDGVRVAADAGVKRLVLFHHDPNHHDDAIDEIVERARSEFENTVAAQEGATLIV